MMWSAWESAWTLTTRTPDRPLRAHIPHSRAPLAVIAAYLGLFVGGAAIGGALAEAFAPDSWLAEAAGFFALPLAFAAGLQAWYGLALFGLVLRALGSLWGSRSREPRVRHGVSASLPGAFVFLPFSSTAGAAAGIVVGLASPTHAAWLVALVYWVVGTGHGALAWALARGGFLTPPEST
jgi:hypothetical protein